MVERRCNHWEVRGERHRGKAVGKGVVGGVGGGVVEGWVGVGEVGGQPQHWKDGGDEARCDCC